MALIICLTSTTIYDKLIGNHNAVVCVPTGFFEHELVQLYRGSNGKVIALSDKSGTDAVDVLLEKFHWFAHCKRLTDKVNEDFFNYFHECTEAILNTKTDEQAVHSAVDLHILLDIDSLTNWEQLCSFLQVETPLNDPLPKRLKSTVGIDLFTRPILTLNELTMIHSEKFFKLFTFLCIGVGFTINGRLVARESAPAAAANVFGICIMAITYWQRRCVLSSQETTATLVSITSASSEVEKPKPKVVSKAAGKIKCKTEFKTNLPVSAFIPPHLW